MQLSAADIGNLTSAAIDQPVAGPAGPFFRRAFSMRFQTGGSPDDLAVDTAATAFQASFSSNVYNVLDADSPVTAVARQVDTHTVRIELERPWSIKRITLKTNLLQYLMEADVAVIQSTPSPWSCAVTPDPLVQDHDVAMGASTAVQDYLAAHPIQIQLLRVDGDAVAPEPTVSIRSGVDLDVDFTAAVFAVRAIQDGTTPIDLTVADLSSVSIETVPTGPRIGICAPADSPGELEPEASFWHLPGQIRDAAAYTAANAQAENVFGDALARHLKMRLAAYADQEDLEDLDNLDVVLVVDSDAPCQAHIDTDIYYHLVCNTVIGPEDLLRSPEKQVIRFPTPTTVPQSLCVALPPTAQVVQTELEMSASFGSPPATPTGPGLAPLPDNTSSGVNLTVGRWVAQPVESGEALRLTEIALGIMGLEKGTELLVVLRADNNGAPGGAVMARQQIRLATIGRCRYVHLPLDPVIEVTARRFWILATAQSGSAVWLTRDDPDGNGMAVAHAGAAGGFSAPVNTLPGRQGYVALFSRHAPASASGPLTLQVGNAPVELSVTDNESVQADPAQLTAALNACLAAPGQEYPATEAGTMIPLRFTASAKGLLTVYPPRVVYDLSS